MKVKSKSDIRIILASGIFVLVTASKLLLPSQTEALRARAREALSRDYDYAEAVKTLGERISGGEAAESVSRLLGGEAEAAESAAVKPEGEFSPVSIEELRRIRTAALPENYVSIPTESAPTPTETPEAVTAFLARQAEYAPEALPADVCADMPALPFDYSAPVSGYSSSGFGFRLHPIKNEVKFHYGTDFAVYGGTAVLCFAEGVVTMAGWDNGYGNYVIVDHAGGWRTLYAHLSGYSVLCGDAVAAGETIARSGDSGEVTGPHLHFELMCDGVYYNPEYWLA